MELSRFWELIDRARGSRDDKGPSADPQKLQAVLKDMGTVDLASFGTKFNDLLCDLNMWEIWGAGYTLCAGMGDDSFHYFRSWIIGKGQRTFEQALHDPEGLVDFIDPNDEEAEFDNELLEYVALKILEERGESDPREGASRFSDDDPSGVEWEEEGVEETYPKLLALSIKLGISE
jgi:hypothetical protein